MKRLLSVAALLIALTPAAFAQTVTGTGKYSWELPKTTNCAGAIGFCLPAPLTGEYAITAVEGFISTSPIPDHPAGPPTLTLTANATTATYSAPVPNGSTIYARWRVRTAKGPGLLSAEVPKLIQVDNGVPGEITNVTVIFTITAAEPPPQ